MRLQQYREKKGWTQEQLSKASGVSQSYISELEKGKKQPRVIYAKMLAKALGVPLDELIEDDQPKAV